MNLWLTNHARVRALDRYGWDIEKAKERFLTSYPDLEALPEGNSELPDEGVTWIVDKSTPHNSVTVITIHDLGVSDIDPRMKGRFHDRPWRKGGRVKTKY